MIQVSVWNGDSCVAHAHVESLEEIGDGVFTRHGESWRGRFSSISQKSAVITLLTDEIANDAMVSAYRMFADDFDEHDAKGRIVLCERTGITYYSPMDFTALPNFFARYVDDSGVLSCNAHYLLQTKLLVEEGLKPSDIVTVQIPQAETEDEKHSGDKYVRTFNDRFTDEEFQADVYDVLIAFDVKCPALQHAAKKILCAGVRGKATTVQDIGEAIDALIRAKQFAERQS